MKILLTNLKGVIKKQMKEYERLTETKKINEYCSTVECGEHCEDCYVGKLYKRLALLEDKIERGELVENTVVTYVNMGRSNSKTLIDKALKYDELKAKIENGTLIELPKKCYLITKDDYLIHKCDIYEMKFSGISGNLTRIRAKTPFGTENFNYRDIGTIVFLTKAEAEKKLKELKGK